MLPAWPRETMPVDRDVSYCVVGRLADGQFDLSTNRSDLFSSADQLIDRGCGLVDHRIVKPLEGSEN